MRASRGIAWIALLVACTARVGDDPERDLAASLEVEVRAATVRFVFHVTNSGTSPVEFTFPSSQRYDFRVETPAGETLWHWSADRAFLQVITTTTLRPGESWDIAEEWEPGDASGRYVAVGWLTSQERRLEQRRSFDLP